MGLRVTLLCEEGRVFWQDISHSHSDIAVTAKIFKAIWFPKTAQYKKAGDLVKPLTAGLKAINDDVLLYQALEKPLHPEGLNDFINFVTDYRDSCKKHPNATIHAVM